MLRSFVIVVGVVCLVIGASLVALGVWPAGAALCLAGLILTAGVIFEQHRYKSVVRDRPPQGWVDTGERVVDETIGETVAVYSDPRSGERIYVRVR